MAKQPNIRWRQRDTEEIERLIKNFNAKLYRISKNKPEIADYMPQRLTKTDTIASIETRADFKRVTESLKRFTQRGAEELYENDKGLKTSRWAVDEFERNQREENKRRAKRKKEIEQQEVKQGGKGTGVTRAEMGRIRENAVKPSRKDPSKMSAKEFEKAAQLMERKMRENYTPEQQKLMQINYIRGLMHEGYSDSLIEYMTTIPPEKFAEIVDTDELATFDFIYDPQERAIKEDALWDVWEEHGQGTNVLGISVDDITFSETNNLTTRDFYRNKLKGG